jgi:uncharacterized protein
MAAGTEDDMKSKRLSAQGETAYALIFDEGDEVKAGLLQFTKRQGLGSAHFTAIGAFQRAVLAYFDWDAKEYQHIPIDEQVEVLALTGDIAEKDGEPALHAHVVVGKRDGTAHGGHLIEGHVRPTLEVMIEETPVHLRRRIDPQTGLALIDVDASL